MVPCELSIPKLLARISAHTCCSSQRVWQSDQFPPLCLTIKKKVGENGPIVKSFEMSNMYVLKSGQEKFGTDSSQGTISFWDLRVDRGNAQIRLQEGVFKKLNKDVHHVLYFFAESTFCWEKQYLTIQRHIEQADNIQLSLGFNNTVLMVGDFKLVTPLFLIKS